MDIVILILIAAHLLHETAYGYIIVSPADTVVRFNQSAILNCSTLMTSQEVAWYRYRVGDPYNRRDVYDAGVIDTSYRGRFYIDGDKSKGVFNLVMRWILEDDAGKYECQDDGGLGDKRSAELTVLDGKGPVCQSHIPVEGILGPNDCGYEPETLELSCGVTFHGNSPPQLEWFMKRGEEEMKFPEISSSCNSTANDVACNLTVSTELRMNGSSIFCRTKGSTSYRCSIDNVKVLYAFNNIEGKDKTLNDEVICVANSSQSCLYTWKWFEYKYDIWVASESELTVNRTGWHRCEAECRFGEKTCPIVAMVIHVSSPSNEEDKCAEQDCRNKATVAVLATLLAILLAIIIGIVIYKRWLRHKHIDVDTRRRYSITHGQSESTELTKDAVSKPIQASEESELRHTSLVSQTT